MTRSRNQAEQVVAPLEVLGSRTVEVPAAETLVTGGLRALRPADVSPHVDNPLANQAVTVFVF